jgi:hypothetical protein
MSLSRSGIGSTVTDALAGGSRNPLERLKFARSANPPVLILLPRVFGPISDMGAPVVL